MANNSAQQEKNARRAAKTERRYLTIGCPQEVRSYASYVPPPIPFPILAHVNGYSGDSDRDPWSITRETESCSKVVFFLLFPLVHFVFLNINHRSVSDKTPRGGKPKILRNRLQSEDQVRLLFLKQAFLVCQCSGELSCADPSSGKKAQPQVGRSDEPAQGDRTSLSQSCRLFST